MPNIGEGMLASDMCKTLARTWLVLMAVHILLLGCTTPGQLTRSAFTDLISGDGEPPGHISSGPWHIIIPGDWFASAVDPDNNHVSTVWGGDAHAGITFRIAEIPNFSPEETGPYMQNLRDEAAGNEAVVNTQLDTRRYPEPVLRVETAESVTWTTIVSRGERADLVTVSGPSDQFIESQVSMAAPDSLFLAFNADYTPTEQRIRRTTPHLYDPTGTWRWISDLESGIMIEAVFLETPVLAVIVNMGSQPPYNPYTADSEPPNLIWTGLQFYAITGTDHSPMSVVIHPLMEGYDSFALRVYGCHDCAPTLKEELQDTGSPLRAMLEHVVILDDGKLTR